ncbi:gluconokinase LALA0_S04e04940g [Lachancea lanzarotensis]|uniref:Gluconokinase n=1 Tax=Lachancea lanzarotensis TaxID=1245769 RepID=A0A0C7N1X1_9SACH|nr:uncharacterized protein LALA0_S04e04940g [Lachancea lanzarotensis]CEP61977.1 LALA0S04e04940g1_1 [Lachancea lanzarotensis]
MTSGSSRSKVIVLAGTAGTGKSTIAAKLVDLYKASYPGLGFLEGDTVHPPENIEKMSHGVPLTDDDRWGWLQKVSELSAQSSRDHSGLWVVTCSSLKKKYRDLMRSHRPETDFYFLFLFADRLLILDRVTKREGHFMKANMINSQFSDLMLPEPDEDLASTVDVDNKSVEQVVQECHADLKTFVTE